MSSKYKYEMRGVSATKDDVHAAIKHLDKGLFPNAFCKILPDVAAGDPAYCNLMHADTAGTKTSLAYLHWQETGKLDVWKGIAQDAIVMNLDDMACVGCLDNILLSSTIGRNKKLITKDVISTLINATVEFTDMLRTHGINVQLAGGETADVGDIVRTVDVGYTAFGRLKRSDLVVNNIKAGNVIVGLSSSGQATYEDRYNGGMGSNGLTSARHDVFNFEYADKYPDSYDANNTPMEVVYMGMRAVTDGVTINGIETDIGSLVLSPTRTYMPVLKKVLDEIRPYIDGIIHCTGGGQTKVQHFIKNKHIIKNNLLPVPPLFELIQNESDTSYKEMYQVFNMGHRLEFYLDESHANTIIEIADEFNIDAQIIGYVDECKGEKVTITAPDGSKIMY